MKRGVALFLFVIALAVVGTFVSCRARAAQCTPWPALKQVLAEQWGEVPIGGGLIDGNTIIQVLASPDGGTFTVVAIDRANVACSIASGFGWEPGHNPHTAGQPS